MNNRNCIYPDLEGEKMNYIIKMENVKVTVKDLEINYDEKRAYDEKSGEEIFVREIEIENDIKLFDIYKKEKGLMTSYEIKELREIYGLNQKEFSKILGLGEVSINRFENGSIQTVSVNSTLSLARHPQVFKELLIKNSDVLSSEAYNKCYEKTEELLTIGKHKIANFEKHSIEALKFNPYSVIKISEKIINVYNKNVEEKNKKYSNEWGVIQSIPKITQLTLQKLLYYVQGLTSVIKEEPAFNEFILNWDYGPVVREIYDIYKDYGANEISEQQEIQLSPCLEEIIEIVVRDYGRFNPSALIELTHEETPWKSTKKNDVIEFDIIKDYFKKVYNN